MVFGDKLQSLRKDKKLSQEELADKLGISRQAVSKWESGQTYPEMDKLILLCKIFNVSLDELTNDSIKEINVDNKQKNKIDGFIGEIVNFIDKTVNMFTNMDAKNIVRCILEMIILLIILRICYTPFRYIDYLLGNIIKYLPTTLYHILDGIFYLIIMIIYLSLYLAVAVYYFDKRWLSKYEKEDIIKSNSKVEDKENGKHEVKEELVIKKESGFSKIMNVLGEIFIVCFKIFVIFMAIPFIFIIIFASFALIISILLMFKGAIYIGLILTITFGIGLISIFIEVLFNFVFNRHTNFDRIFKIFIFSLIGLGISMGLFINEIYHINYINDSSYTTNTYTYDMKDDLYISTGQYIVDESLTNNVKIEVSANKYARYDINEIKDNISIYTYPLEYNEFKELINNMINDLANKEIHNYSNDISVKIYTSSANIEKLENRDKTIYRSTNYCDDYELESKIDNLEEDNTSLKDKNSKLQTELDNYKTTLKGLVED